MLGKPTGVFQPLVLTHTLVSAQSQCVQYPPFCRTVMPRRLLLASPSILHAINHAVHLLIGLLREPKAVNQLRMLTRLSVSTCSRCAHAQPLGQACLRSRPVQFTPAAMHLCRISTFCRTGRPGQLGGCTNHQRSLTRMCMCKANLHSLGPAAGIGMQEEPMMVPHLPVPTGWV